MRTATVDAGLAAAELHLTAAFRSANVDNEAFGVSKCDVADATYAFLGVLESDAGFFRAVVVRWIMGWISSWRREHCGGA